MSTKNVKLLLASDKLNNNWINKFLSFLDQFAEVDLVDNTNVEDQLTRITYDIILMDESLLLTGYSLIRQFLRIQPAMRVIVVTDTQDWKRAREAFKNGASEYVTSTIAKEELIKIIQEI